MKMIYQEAFPVGCKVVVVERNDLAEFRAKWKLHHPLVEEQLAFAARAAQVESVGFYHGGDVLYKLKDIPGIWHECCLRKMSVTS